MTPEDLETVRRITRSRCGALIDPSRPYPIEIRLHALARREGLASPTDLVAKARSEKSERLLWAIAEALTPNETSFFRDGEPFQQFAEEIAPDLIARRNGGTVRVWSAACGTGQEAYSLAMIADSEQFDSIEIFASDIGEHALERARAGAYTQFEVQKGLPIRHLVRYFDKQDDAFVIAPHIRERVRWRRINLLADLSALGRFDVIFCRNVVSSFDPPTARRVLEQIARALPEDGRLVLGREESPVGVTDALEPVHGLPGVFGPAPQRGVRAA